MVIAGIIVTLLGFLISVMSLTLTQSNSARLFIVLVGLVVSLCGIIGMINRAYLKNAIWRR